MALTSTTETLQSRGQARAQPRAQPRRHTAVDALEKVGWEEGIADRAAQTGRLRGLGEVRRSCSCGQAGFLEMALEGDSPQDGQVQGRTVAVSTEGRTHEGPARVLSLAVFVPLVWPWTGM